MSDGMRCTTEDECEDQPVSGDVAGMSKPRKNMSNAVAKQSEDTKSNVEQG